MTGTGKTLLLAIVLGMALAGCEESAKHPVQVRPSVAPPLPMAAERKGPLPFPPYQPHPIYYLTGQRPGVDILAEKVEGKYEAGQRDYQAGNLDAARQDFNDAVNLILSSGMTLETDPRLGKLFDQIADTVHNYELEASEQSEEESPTEAEAPTEPSPIEEIAGMTLPAGDPRLALKAEQELITVPHDIPLAVNDSVLSYLSFFTTPRGRAIVENGLRRAGRYNEMIRRVLKEEGLPQDLMYLAQAESAFIPRARSHAGAGGIWQFMPFRGEEYDLHRTYWVDERNDPEKATRAAAQHLRDLYQMFGDWYLVMAAYNSGPLNVVRAVERTGYADFWELRKRNALPVQTKNYVPIIIALTLIAKDPALYGVQVTDVEKPPPVDVVRPGHPISLRLVSDITSASVDALRSMNPDLLRMYTPNDPEYELKIPAGTGARFKKYIAEIPPTKWTSWRLHRVASDESLAEIARRYRVTLVSLEHVNHLGRGEAPKDGVDLIIPAAPVRERLRLVHYRVRRGDTLEGIAARYGVSAAQLKRWNRLRSSWLRHGARLRIYVRGEEPGFRNVRWKRGRMVRRRVSAASASHLGPGEILHHRVRSGETLYSIARAYRTSVNALRQANPFLAARGLEAGDLLTIIVPQH